jgi:superfamily II DNA or RNA helicase
MGPAVFAAPEATKDVEEWKESHAVAMPTMAGAGNSNSDRAASDTRAIRNSNASGPSLSAGTRDTWQYPRSAEYGERRYQLEIAAAALFQNTLVCLPTGMGKTLVAAVVMHNFYRWFPAGQVVFLGPTKPIVSQQTAACHKIVALPERETAHLMVSYLFDFF